MIDLDIRLKTFRYQSFQIIRICAPLPASGVVYLLIRHRVQTTNFVVWPTQTSAENYSAAAAYALGNKQFYALDPFIGFMLQKSASEPRGVTLSQRVEVLNFFSLPFLLHVVKRRSMVRVVTACMAETASLEGAKKYIRRNTLTITIYAFMFIAMIRLHLVSEKRFRVEVRRCVMSRSSQMYQ
jgi:hypothetical protein